MFRAVKIKKSAAISLILIPLYLLLVSPAYATTILSQRSLQLSTAIASAQASHTFSFSFPYTETVGSITFQYCTDPIDVVPCTNPTGSDVSAAVLSSQSGETGFSILSQNVNTVTLTRTPASVGNAMNSYVFTNVTNPSVLGPFFVRIAAYASSDGSGRPVSFSAVAGSINQSININGEVPQILYFCSAVSIPGDCSTATGDFIDFGNLSSSATSSGTSQFLVGTNAPNGYTITTAGPTMTSGTNIINSMGSPATSQKGTPQFGINLRANLSPPLGADTTGDSGGVPMPDYNLPNNYTYRDGDTIAANPGRSLVELYTVSYIVNVNSSQPAGVYNTTITYICTAGF